MHNRLKRLKQLRDAASRAVEAARSRPAEALKNVTENMLDRGAAAGLPPDAAAAGSAAAARLWTKISPRDPVAQARLAEALVRDGQAAEALKVVQLPPDDRSDAALLAESWLARADLVCGRVPEATRRVERLVAMAPSAGSAIAVQLRAVLASAALDLCRPELAVQVLGSPTDSPLDKVARARLALLEDKVPEARRLLEEAAAPTSEEAQAWLAISLAAAGETQFARSILAGLRSRGPERPWVLAVQGWLMTLAGATEAKETLNRSLNQYPHLAGPRFLLGWLAEREGNLASAQEAFQEAARLAPSWTEPWQGIIRTALAAGDQERARQAARKIASEGGSTLLAGLAAGLSGEAELAQQLWQGSSPSLDRAALRERAQLRAAVAWQLTSDGRHEKAVPFWRQVAAHASEAGTARITLSRWALDAARQGLTAPQPAYYAIEAALAAASALQPEKEGLVLASCSASFLARGPAAARKALEDAVARGATDERITGLLRLIDNVTKGRKAASLSQGRDQELLEAAQLARAGDAPGCMAQLEQLQQRATSSPARAATKATQALVRLRESETLLRQGQVAAATPVLQEALGHVPGGLDRDRLIHELAALTTLSAQREDKDARAEGAPPTAPTIQWWQQALRYWTALAGSPAYWADLARRVLELDDPRLTPADVEQLRASLPDMAAEFPAALAAEALAGGHRSRARAFIALIIGAPVTAQVKERALVSALTPLTADVRTFADASRQQAAETQADDLVAAYHQAKKQALETRGQLAEAAPEGCLPLVNARDELALALLHFENLFDRSRRFPEARDALVTAAELAGSETLRSELSSKLQRVRAQL